MVVRLNPRRVSAPLTIIKYHIVDRIQTCQAGSAFALGSVDDLVIHCAVRTLTVEYHRQRVGYIRPRSYNLYRCVLVAVPNKRDILLLSRKSHHPAAAEAGAIEHHLLCIFSCQW